MRENRQDPPALGVAIDQERRRWYGARPARPLFPVQPEWAVPLARVARMAELPYDPVFGRFPTRSSMELMTAFRHLGASLAPVEGLLYWDIREDHSEGLLRRSEMPGLERKMVYANGMHGAMRIELDGAPLLLVRPGLFWQDHPIVGAPDLDTLLDVADLLAGAMEELNQGRIHFASNTPRQIDPVSEQDLVLDAGLRNDVLSFLDAFEKKIRKAGRLGYPYQRGALLIGPPGTGKTMTVRYILTRLARCRRYVYIPDPVSQAAGKGLSSLAEELAGQRRPAVVIIEDIDRILESGVTSPQYLLNLFDGLLHPACSVLWIATSNDPSALEENLLDRPGRFDRIFRFERPALDEREELIRRYTLGEADAHLVRELAVASDGLTGAHLRELCESAAIESEEGDLEPALRKELARSLEQHERSKKPRELLRNRQGGIGFVGG